MKRSPRSAISHFSPENSVYDKSIFVPSFMFFTFFGKNKKESWIFPTDSGNLTIFFGICSRKFWLFTSREENEQAFNYFSKDC